MATGGEAWPVRALAWRKVSGDERQAAEAFLKAREKFCVAACARFIAAGTKAGKREHVWYLCDSGGGLSSLLINSRNSLFPVFGTNSAIPCPGFLKRFLLKVPIHLVQGFLKDVETLELLMEDRGYFAAERIDYDLMGLDTAPRTDAFKEGPSGLVIRAPLAGDKVRLFKLHSAYEKEEVLPKNAVFNPAYCRYSLERILSSKRVLVAELDGQVVGKINTNAVSFTSYQIGGVYVCPEFRSLGIATRMIAVFSADLLAQGKGIVLFCKKHNKAAQKAYLKAGFSVFSDYRISYF